jgi:phage I-like protein
MTNATARAIFRTDLASQGNAAPEWVELFPAGPELVARDGRRWIANPQAVIKAFAENRAPLAIDWEHAQAHLAPKGQEAPAAGWITELEERDGAVWGRVDWVEKAARQIVEKEYRFLSPDFQHRADGRITKLNGAGLVNRPALELTALSREQPPKETPMLKAIARALGLAETADEAAILAALAARDSERKALCQALRIDEGSDTTALAAAVGRLQDDTATALAAAGGGNAAEVAALQSDLAATRTALAALQQKDHEREIDAALDQAVTAGKITPASRDSYRAMCALDGGIEKFNALVATLPVIGGPSGLDGRSASLRPQDEPDANAIAARARKYQDEQHATGNLITITEAVAHVKELKP